MRCISPILIRKGGRRDFVPCGRCNFCLQVKRADWSFRLLQELKRASSAKFLTLTYDDEHLPSDLSVSKRHLQLFTKLLRKANTAVSSFPLRYYAVGEYGTETSRAHYHSIIFNLHPSVINRLDKIWNKGHIKVGTVTPASIHYVTKYVINRTQEMADRAPPFALMSRRPGIGISYIHTHMLYHRGGQQLTPGADTSQFRNFANVNGAKSRLPRFYKDKFFTPREREKMAIDAVRLEDHAYLMEIYRLSMLHDNPEGYYDQLLRAELESVVSKINSLNTF